MEESQTDDKPTVESAPVQKRRRIRWRPLAVAVVALVIIWQVAHAVTHGGPAGATTTLVYKVFNDGRAGGDLGSSAAQSVILMLIVIALTAIQFRYIERKVNY